MLAPILSQTSSQSSAAASTSSKQCHQCITTRAMSRSKPALNSLNAHLKCTYSGGDIHMALLQIHTTPLVQGLPSLATLLFKHLLYSVMPVIDRKPIGGDNDDDHHSKLVYRQHKMTQTMMLHQSLHLFP